MTDLRRLPNLPALTGELACEKRPDMWFHYLLVGKSKSRVDQPILRYVKQLCAACPVREGCLEYALEHDEKDGIWGGLTPEERDDLKKGAEDVAA